LFCSRCGPYPASATRFFLFCEIIANKAAARSSKELPKNVAGLSVFLRTSLLKDRHYFLLGKAFMTVYFKKFILDDSGATAIEYGLIAALIAVVLITVLTTVGTNLNTKFASVAGALN